MNRGQSIPAAHASMNHHSCPGRALARLQFAWPRKIKVIKLHWSGLSTLDDRKKRRAGRKPSSKRKTGLWWLLGKRFIDIIITYTKKVHPKLNYWIVRFSPFHCNHVRSILPSFSSFNFLRASLNSALPCLVMSGQDDKIIGRSSIKWDVQMEQTEHGNDNGKEWWWMGKWKSICVSSQLDLKRRPSKLSSGNWPRPFSNGIFTTGMGSVPALR